MERTFKVISMSEDYKRALRIADTIVARNRLDRAFERNMMIKQKLHGIIVSLASIIVAWYLSEFYGQTEYFLMVPLFLVYGFYLITTKENLVKELKEN